MWQKSKLSLSTGKRRRTIWLLGILGLFLVACGGATTNMSTSTGSGTTASAPVMMRAANSAAGVSQSTNASGSSSGPTSQTGQYGPQYLVKNLQVTMEVQNPVQSASEVQQWVAFSDPQSTSDGSDYENAGNGQFTITLTFLVDVAHYTQVESYLRDYAGQKGHTLDSLKETVQDVTNDYIDSQSTLTNLRAEQQRLLGFMNQAQNVNDAVNIEQQLAQVEGQINDIEAHLNALKGQTTFYPVTVTIQPVGSAPPPPPPPSPWSVIPIWQGAWSGVVSVWQVLVAVLVWLLAFSVYIVPAGILVWLIRKRPWKARALPQVSPAGAFSGMSGAAVASASPLKTSDADIEAGDPDPE